MLCKSNLNFIKLVIGYFYLHFLRLHLLLLSQDVKKKIFFVLQVRFDDPRFRTAEAGPTLGHYWKNGKEIENTEDYVEEVTSNISLSSIHGYVQDLSTILFRNLLRLLAPARCSARLYICTLTVIRKSLFSYIFIPNFIQWLPERDRKPR